MFMDIQTFLESCIGQWFSQRSSYQFDTEKAESHKSELTVEWLNTDHSLLVSLCQEHRIDPNQAIGGQQVSWNSSVDYGQKKQTGSATMIIIPDSNTPKIGKIIQSFKSNPSSQGKYSLGEDEALNLTLEVGDFLMEERIWFASPNLRLRTSLMKGENGYSRTAFYSEIRRLPPQEVA
ncbi:unknown [Crocosphaera subtropica ATCC 51142]|uniref:Chromophore lyase CpcS/CpeS n=2 Tax=Crocosphaera TaxID=263510 RepID=B1X1U3_CROS5|nr:unknown [Crocosphaera subtropica ATCC 51142]